MSEGSDRWKRRLGVALVATSLVYTALLTGALAVWGDFDEEQRRGIGSAWFEPGAEAQWPAGSSGLKRHFATWDAQHYLYLAQAGYRPGVKSNAFYPLWPAIIRVTTRLTKCDGVIAGMVLANGCGIVAWWLFHGIAARRFGREAADCALLLLLAFPGSLFQRFVYSEALFLLLLMVLWNGLERRRYGWAGAAALLLPLTRGVGVFCVLPIMCHWIERVRHLGAQGIGWRTSVAGVGLVLAPVAGWAGYLALMGWWTGNPLAGIEAQQHWGVHAVGNLWNARKFVEGFLTPTAWHDFRGSMLDRMVFVLAMALLPAIRRLGWDIVVWTYVLAVVPAMSGTFVSFTRFAGCAFPVFLGLAYLLCHPTRQKARWAVLGVFAMLHAVLVWRFLNFRWAG